MNVNIEKATGRTVFRFSCDPTPKDEVTVNVRKPIKGRK